MNTIQKEIRTGLKGLRMSARPDPDGVIRPSFLSPDDVTQILKYLDEKGALIMPTRERLVEE